jgi:hypothetical protein
MAEAGKDNNAAVVVEPKFWYFGRHGTITCIKKTGISCNSGADLAT